MDEPLRFNDLLERIPGIAPNILSQRLRRLEQNGLAVAEPYSRRPPRSLYELTQSGRDLAGALRQLTDGAPGTPRPPSRRATAPVAAGSRRSGTAPPASGR